MKLQQIICAFDNVPLVGDVYDQQHSDVQLQARQDMVEIVSALTSCVNSLKVIILDEKISNFLQSNDPQALNQLKKSLEDVEQLI